MSILLILHENNLHFTQFVFYFHFQMKTLDFFFAEPTWQSGMTQVPKLFLSCDTS